MVSSHVPFQMSVPAWSSLVQISSRSALTDCPQALVMTVCGAGGSTSGPEVLLISTPFRSIPDGEVAVPHVHDRSFQCGGGDDVGQGAVAGGVVGGDPV